MKARFWTRQKWECTGPYSDPFMMQGLDFSAGSTNGGAIALKPKYPGQCPGYTRLYGVGFKCHHHLQLKKKLPPHPSKT